MKSIEEAAREQAAIKVRTDSEYIQAKQDFKAGVEFAQRWISVDDELPKKGDRVLLKDKDDEIECWLVYHEYDVAFLMKRFTHWRYLELI